jgi:DNA polymerase II small subunit
LRIAEPQPPLPKELVAEIFDLPNLYFVSSPSHLRIGITKNFSGFDVMIYHGFSFPYFADTIESIRLKGGLENTDNIMSYLLRKRHFAPTQGSTQYQLGYDKDPLVIKVVPDLFVTGHIHRASIKNYRNITLLNCSCWISQTPYQEKRGLVPQPARAIYVNLKTRESKILNFEK